MLSLMFASSSLARTKTLFVEVRLGEQLIKVEVVNSEQGRARGMMFRRDFGDAQGMLFVFPDEEVRSFWMKNTYIPLSIGFFDKDFRLFDIQDMEPMRSDMQTDFARYTSVKPAQFALEVPRGWFAIHRIKLGDQLKGKTSPRPKFDALQDHGERKVYAD